MVEATETSSDATVLRAMAAAANQAPSGGNVQPWQLERTDGALRVLLDTSYAVSLDVAWRGSYVALGAAVWNARVEAAAHGRLGPVALLPEGPESRVAAEVRLDDDRDPALAALREAMWQRSTNRRAGDPAVRFDEGSAAALRAAAEAEAGRAAIVADRAGLQACGALLGASDRLRCLSPWLLDEMLSELRWPGREPVEVGLDVRTLELGRSDAAAMRLLRRSPAVRRLARPMVARTMRGMTRQALARSSALVAITRAGHEPRDYLQGGAAMQRVWVTAEQLGWAVQPVSPVALYAVDASDHRALVPARHTEALAETTAALRARLGLEPQERLQLLLRLAAAPEPSERSLRRPLEEVLSA